MYAAQAIPPIDAEIAKKGHLWMETNSLDRMMHLHRLEKWGNSTYEPPTDSFTNQFPLQYEL